MIAANIGRLFLDAYNEKFKRSYTPRKFFEEVYCETFYNHPKYMMTGGNSPLENPKLSWEKMRVGQLPYETPERREDRIQKTIHKIDTEPADMSIAIGYPSLDILAPTSGQTSNIKLPLTKDDAYLSWIGAGLGLGVSGGLCLFFSNKQILLDIFEGWNIYRQYLNTHDELKGNQITSWNTQWLAHRYNDILYNEDDKSAGLSPFEKEKDNSMKVRVASWPWLLFCLAKKYPKTNETTYIYNLGQTNTTVGFIPIELPGIRSLDQLYEKYFEVNPAQLLEAGRHLFGTAMGLKKACEMGAIGVFAMEPKGFRDLLLKGAIPKYNEKDEEQKLNFYTYKIWLLAMINKEEAWERSIMIAQELIKYQSEGEKTRTDKIRLINELLEVRYRLGFVSIIKGVLENAENNDFWHGVLKEVHEMDGNEFKYYSTLISAQYTYFKSKQKNI